MITEAITIGVIIGGCAAAVWYAKKKFQPEIEQNLKRLEGFEIQRKESFHKKKN
jgi:hypothetical protein